ncbi:MAG: peptide chain release factor 2 [Candidatus Omnitrophica bacterium]|nr:peptide chain release factor 2 [Candidatus Omnitrophota bacterium]
MLEDLKRSLDNAGKKLEEIRGYLDYGHKRSRMTELEGALNSPEVWKNQEEAKKLSEELRSIKSVINPFVAAEKDIISIKELAGMVEADDTHTLTEIKSETDKLAGEIDRLEFRSLLGEKTDKCNAILSINAGAGGTESCDWVSMIFRMYVQWAESHGHKLEVLDQLTGEEAGIKNVTFTISGEFAYGNLKSEIGVHRLVRISPFDANKRRHTSFASVDVVPEILDDIDIQINETDLKIDTYRSGGAGGQHVNTTDSAVRITHIPSGLVVQCQNERSQHKNKASAMNVLKSRLYDLEKRRRDEEINKSYDSKKKIEWGSQIRSYVLHPYKMVKDHRTDFETSSAEDVLDGELDGFIEAYLKFMARG